MKNFARSLQTSVLIFSSLYLIACGPIEQLPGLRLGGNAAQTPENFDFVDDYPLIQLEAWGTILPRVVNIWGVGEGQTLYVWGAEDSGWVKRTAEHPDIRVRIGDDHYALRAERLRDADLEERARVLAKYQTKYGSELTEIFGRPATPDDFAMVYRLTPR